VLLSPLTPSSGAVQFILRPTVSRPVRLGIGHPFGPTKAIFNHTFILYCRIILNVIIIFVILVLSLYVSLLIVLWFILLYIVLYPLDFLDQNKYNTIQINYYSAWFGDYEHYSNKVFPIF
jgi:hypothetical protein